MTLKSVGFTREKMSSLLSHNGSYLSLIIFDSIIAIRRKMTGVRNLTADLPASQGVKNVGTLDFY